MELTKLYKKLENLELKYFKEIKKGSFNQRCNQLENHLQIYVFSEYKNNLEIDFCNLEEELYTAMMLRIYYIENNINITENMKRLYNPLS